MTRDDIIRLAREAGIVDWSLHGRLESKEEALERFAALVAAAEREKVAAWMIERDYATGHGDTIEGLLKALEWQAKERARGFL
jgi:predicted TIM-barrel fold metal-dependent hydrolase